MSSFESPFIIRVYGIFINNKDQLLLSDEYFLDTPMIKFPGGGLEFGEGTRDCLIREIREEMGKEIIDIKHYYTTDFYQKALFYSNRQLISIYYSARFVKPPAFRVSVKSSDFSSMENGDQSFRWIHIKAFNPESLTFPIDRKVGEMIKMNFKNL